LTTLYTPGRGRCSLVHIHGQARCDDLGEKAIVGRIN
jgi:hypothetical protein